MAVAPVEQSVQTSGTRPQNARLVSPWIVNAWVDQTFILLTPLLAAPIVLFLYSSWVGVKAETIGLIVTAFFALGHHLPGMIRAYGDRELFHRFQWRFILVPPFLFAVFFPLYLHHYSSFRLITMFWATWHGLMQLYGFARIYDLKAGSKSMATAYWDWILCLTWFITPQFVSPAMMATVLEYWYAIGGPLVSPAMIKGIQFGSLAIAIAALIGFGLNCLIQSIHGSRPNPIKLLMLASGIGFWWFAAVEIQNVVLGVAMFDISHDVQYLAIAWIYNCRRVNSNPRIGQFMSYLFRRGMVLLYLGLIFSYGAIGLIPSLVQDETVKTVFMGFLWTSTILHYYMDGFIWKVRESSTRASLGLGGAASTSVTPQSNVSGLAHFLKWSPIILFVGWLLTINLDGHHLTAARKSELERLYIEQVSMSNSLPADDEEKSWLYSRFLQVQNIAAAVPNCRPMQFRAAIMLANFGRNKESMAIFDRELADDPSYSDGYLGLAFLQIKLGNLDLSYELFEKALHQSLTDEIRTRATMGMGEIFILRNEPKLAQVKFDEAMKYDSKLAATIKPLLEKRRKSIPLEKP